MTMITSTTSGSFSVGATWVGGVAPVDGDGFTIATGHTVTFNMDQTAWAGMAASVITGALVWSTSAGTYVLKMAGNITGVGTLTIGSVGTAYPTNCFAQILMTGTSNLNLTGSGSYQIYCTEPTRKYVKLTQAANVSDTALVVDNDISADAPWAVSGATIRISDNTAAALDNELRTIDTISGTTINITAGLTNAKAIGAAIVLEYRNIQIIGVGQNYGLLYPASSYIRALISTFLYPYYGQLGTTVDGVVCNFTIGCYGGRAATIAAAFSTSASYGYATSVASGFISSPIIAGCYDGISISDGYVDGTEIIGYVYGLYGAAGSIFSNILLRGGWTGDMVYLGGAKFYNCLFGSSVEYVSYNSSLVNMPHSYVESFNHDQVADAFRCWTLGGIVDKQSSVYPTDKTYSYSHACGSASYPCYRQIATTIEPNSTLKIDWRMRKSVSMAILPKCEIIDVFNDPLVVSTDVALATATMTNSVDTWESGVLNYTNTATLVKKVLVRFTAQNASGNFYEFGEAMQYSSSAGIRIT